MFYFSSGDRRNCVNFTINRVPHAGMYSLYVTLYVFFICVHYVIKKIKRCSTLLKNDLDYNGKEIPEFKCKNVYNNYKNEIMMRNYRTCHLLR